MNPYYKVFQSPKLVDWSRATFTGGSAGGDCFLLPYMNQEKSRFDYILLDTGLSGTFQHDVIYNMIRMLNIINKGGAITGIIITHVHKDHIGGLQNLAGFGNKLSIFNELQWIAIGMTHMPDNDKGYNIWKGIQSSITSILHLKSVPFISPHSIDERKRLNDAIMRRVFCTTNGQIILRGWSLDDTPRSQYPINFYYKTGFGPLYSSNNTKTCENNTTAPETGNEEDKVDEKINMDDIDSNSKHEDTSDGKQANNGDKKGKGGSQKGKGGGQKGKGGSQKGKGGGQKGKSGDKKDLPGTTPMDDSPVNKSSITTIYMTYPTFINGQPSDKPKFYCFTGDSLFSFSHFLTYGLPHNAEFADQLFREVISHRNSNEDTVLYYNVPIDVPVDETILQKVYDEIFTLHIHYKFETMIQVIDDADALSKAMDEAHIHEIDTRTSVERYMRRFKELAQLLHNRWDAFQIPHHGSFGNSLGITHYSMFPLEHGNNIISDDAHEKDLVPVYSQVSNLFFVTSPGTEKHISPEYIRAFQDKMFKATKVLVVYPSLYPDLKGYPDLESRKKLFNNQRDSPFIVLASLAIYCLYSFAPLLTYDNHMTYYDMEMVERYTFLSFRGKQLVLYTTIDGRKLMEYLKKDIIHVERVMHSMVSNPKHLTSNNATDLSYIFNLFLINYMIEHLTPRKIRQVPTTTMTIEVIEEIDTDVGINAGANTNLNADANIDINPDTSEYVNANADANINADVSVNTNTNTYADGDVTRTNSTDTDTDRNTDTEIATTIMRDWEMTDVNVNADVDVNTDVNVNRNVNTDTLMNDVVVENNRPRAFRLIRPDQRYF